jgi:hypothetical protein
MPIACLQPYSDLSATPCRGCRDLVLAFDCIALISSGSLIRALAVIDTADRGKDSLRFV